MGFYRGRPAGWQDAVGNVAALFHFPPSEIWRMTISEFVFWVEQGTRIVKARGY